MPPRADHMGLTVEDIGVMVEFYRDTLGFEVVLRAHSDDEEMDTEPLRTLVGIDDADLEVAFLDAPGCAVELVRYDAPPGDSVEGVSNNDVGAKHFAFEVDDIDEWYDRFEATGNVSTTSPPQDFGFNPQILRARPRGQRRRAPRSRMRERGKR